MCPWASYLTSLSSAFSHLKQRLCYNPIYRLRALTHWKWLEEHVASSIWSLFVTFIIRKAQNQLYHVFVFRDLQVIMPARSTKLKSSIFRPQLRDAIVKQPINSGFNIRPGLLQALRDEDHRACPQGLQATILTHHISFMPIKNAVLERPSQEHAVLPVINQFTIIIILLRKWCHVSTLDSSKALGQCFVVMRT